MQAAQSTFNHQALALTKSGAIGLLGALTALVLGGTGARAQRTTVPLDGTWQLAEGTIGEVPAHYDRTAPVPGLVDMSQPAYDPALFFNNKRRFGPEDAQLAKRSY